MIARRGEILLKEIRMFVGPLFVCIRMRGLLKKQCNCISKRRSVGKALQHVEFQMFPINFVSEVCSLLLQVESSILVTAAVPTIDICFFLLLGQRAGMSNSMPSKRLCTDWIIIF